MKEEVKKEKRYLKTENKYIYFNTLFIWHLIPKYNRTLWHNYREIGLEGLSKSPGPSLSCKLLSAVCLGSSFSKICLSQLLQSFWKWLQHWTICCCLLWFCECGKQPLLSAVFAPPALPGFAPLHLLAALGWGAILRLTGAGSCYLLLPRQICVPDTEGSGAELPTDWLLEQNSWQLENLNVDVP